MCNWKLELVALELPPLPACSHFWPERDNYVWPQQIFSHRHNPSWRGLSLGLYIIIKICRSVAGGLIARLSFCFRIQPTSHSSPPRPVWLMKWWWASQKSRQRRRWFSSSPFFHIWSYIYKTDNFAFWSFLYGNNSRESEIRASSQTHTTHTQNEHSHDTDTNTVLIFFSDTYLSFLNMSAQFFDWFHLTSNDKIMYCILSHTHIKHTRSLMIL